MIAYKQNWPDGTNLLQIDFWALRQKDSFLKSIGTSRLDVYLNIHSKLWPEDIQHRWFVRGLKAIVEHEVVVLMGCSDSGKSYLMYTHAIMDFFVFPTTSLALVSSTDGRSLEIRLWGRMKEYFNRAKDRFPWLDGFVLDAQKVITSQEIDDDGERGRTLTSGIICVPCMSGGSYVGLGKFIGVKAPNTPGKYDGILKHYGDEVQAMKPSFLDAYSNWVGKGNFKGVMAGNPIDISDPLCMAGEPRDGGWDAFVDEGVTQEWTSRFYGAHVVAFDGRSSPNNDQPGTIFPFLISQRKLDLVAATEGLDSWKWFSQCVGKPSKNMISWRVITLALCKKHRAHDDVIWKGGTRTKLYSLDPAYGGGDRCIGGPMEFGEDVDGRVILLLGAPEIIPIKLNSRLEPEEQIAAFMKSESDRRGIPASNMFWDSFGRGTLGFSFAKVFGASTPVPVDSGMRPTERPVRADLYVEIDTPSGKIKRLKRCDEHYSKFITEMWFSTREAIQSEQVRGLNRETAEEGQMRLYKIVSGNRIEVESKEDLKERIKKSPDLYDWFAIGVEGARRLGFRIERLGHEITVETSNGNRDWFDRIASKVRSRSKSTALSFR